MNVVIVQGRLSSPPRVTELGSGDVLVRYEVTVARDDGPADSVPVAWVGPAKRAPSGDWPAGEEVVVLGRVRRRWWAPPAGPRRSATEVLASDVVRAARRRQATSVLERAAGALGVEPAPP